MGAPHSYATIPKRPPSVPALDLAHHVGNPQHIRPIAAYQIPHLKGENTRNLQKKYAI